MNQNMNGATMMEQLAWFNQKLAVEDRDEASFSTLQLGRSALVEQIGVASQFAQGEVDEAVNLGIDLGYDNPLAEALEKANADDAAVESEASPELQERLNALPESMSKQAVSAHEQRTTWNNTYIEAGSLSAEYAMPGLEVFIDRLEALVPTVEHMEANGMTPQIVFPQRNLADVQRNDTLARHDKTRNGFFRTFPEDAVVDPTDRSKHFPEDMLHDVAVVDSSDVPTYVSVSKDGRCGKNAQAAIAAARELPTVDRDASDEDVLAQATTNQDIYDALQLGRLERGETPVDARTWTLARENATVDGFLRAVWAGFDPGGAELRSYWSYRGVAVGNAGVRFAASGQEALALHPSTS